MIVALQDCAHGALCSPDFALLGQIARVRHEAVMTSRISGMVRFEGKIEVSQRKAKGHVKYKAEQPRDGDGVLACEHYDARKSRRLHFWRLPEPTQFQRHQGGIVTVHWLIACDSCFEAHSDDPLRIHFRTFGTLPSYKRTTRCYK